MKAANQIGWTTTVMLLCIMPPAGGFVCDRSLVDESGSFALTQAVLDDVEGDIQRVVDCVGPQESVVVDAGLTVRLATTVRFTKGVVFTSTEVGESRPVLECPQDMPLFEVRSAGVVLQNFVVSNCELAARDSSALVVNITTARSDEDEGNPDILIDNVDFVDNANVKGPGALYLRAAASAELLNVIFMNNTGRDGGAVGLQADGSTVSFDKCAFLENTALESGGALFQNSSANLTILNSHFHLNQAHMMGGAVSLQGGQLLSSIRVISTNFEGNSVSNHDALNTKPPEQALGGGAIALHGSSLEFRITSTNFTDNSAGADGGGILIRGLTDLSLISGYLESIRFVNNIAEAGGGLSIQSSSVNTTIEVHRAQFIGNVARPNNDGVDSGSVGVFAMSGSESRVIAAKSDSQDNQLRDLHKIDSPTPRGGAIHAQSVAKIVIQECILRNNQALRENPSSRHASGGALHFQASERESLAVISNSTFAENESDEGGAVALDGPWIVDLTKKVYFDGNKAEEQGGAIVMGELSTITGENVAFSMNQAGTNGGAVAIKGYNSHIKLSSSIFKENEATQGSGGALFLPGDGSVVQLLSEILLVGNRARSAGGAIAIFCTNCLLELSQTSVEENSSQEGGGGILAKSFGKGMEITLMDVAFAKNSVFLMDSENKELTGSGGALMIEGAGVKLSTLGFIHFHENKAREGAGIRLVDCGVVTVDNAVFESNSGSTGGGIYATFPNKSTDRILRVTNTIFTANTAIIGGGLMVDGPRRLESHSSGDSATASATTPSRVVLVAVSMQYQNVDEEGAGLFLIGTKGECRHCKFHGNAVRDIRNGFGGAISLRRGAHLSVVNSVLSENSAAIGGGASVIDSTLVGERLELVKNTATSFGGGVSLMGTESADGEVNLPRLEVEESRIEGNNARKGAGISVSVKESSIPQGCLPFIQDMMAGLNTGPSLMDENWQELGSNCNDGQPVMVKLTNVRMERNVAEEAGGGLYLHRPASLCACCGGACTEGCGEIAQAETKSLLDVCSTYWKSNSAAKGHGQDIASAVVAVDVVPGNGRESGRKPLHAINHTSGDALQEFTLRFLDISGRVATTSPPSAVVRLVVNRGTLSGQVDKAVVSGLATFTNAVFSGKPGDFVVTAELPAEFNLPDEALRISIRECVPGEYRQEGGPDEFRCVKCEEQTYSFDPSSPCRPCPDNAICDGKNVTPKDGYWVSNSNPNKTHKCLVKAACNHVSGKPDARSNETFADNQEACSEGYEGILCGSCSEGYGRFRRFECRECPSKSTSIALVATVSFWSLMLLWFLIKSSLKPQTVVRTVVAQQGPSVQVEITPAPQQENQQIKIVGLNRSAEAAKILINFVQLTSFALLIRMQWPRAALGLLRIEDGLSGIAADGGVFFLDCLLQEWNASLFLRQCLLSVAVPVGLLVLLVVFWILRACLKPLEFASLLRHLATSAAVFAYFFYPAIVQRVFSLVHGIRVGRLTTEDGLKSLYWIDGTTTTYFSGNHLLVAAIVGVPTFIVMVGFPMAVVRIVRGQKQQTHDTGLAARYGFLYRAFQENYMQWELVIIVRKVLIVAVVVFGGPWQPRLQGLTCLMIMVVALVAHVSAQPFREEVSELNRLEAYSLSGTVVTLVAGLVFEGTDVAHWVQLVVSVCLMVVAVFVLSRILKAILRDGFEDVDAWLEKEGIVRRDAALRTKISATREWLWGKSMKLFWNQIERMNGDRAWHLERKKTIAYRAAAELERAQQLGITIA